MNFYNSDWDESETSGVTGSDSMNQGGSNKKNSRSKGGKASRNSKSYKKGRSSGMGKSGESQSY